MKKLLVSALAAIVVVSLASVAYAQQAQVNTYRVEGSISGGAGASKAKPKPIKVVFNYFVGEEKGLRPALIKKYSIKFPALKVNGDKFPKCSAAQISNAKSDANCPKGSKVGEGDIRNDAGPSTDLNVRIPNEGGKSSCDARVEVYNSGKNKGALWITGGTNAPDTVKTKCVIPDLGEAIAATYKKSGDGTSLNFTVPTVLLRPSGLENSVIKVGSSIKRISKRIKGKKVGYYESTGCKGGKGDIEVTFTTEAGVATKAKKSVKC